MINCQCGDDSAIVGAGVDSVEFATSDLDLHARLLGSLLNFAQADRLVFGGPVGVRPRDRATTSHRATTSPVTGRPQGSPLLCYGFASRCVHGGNAPFLFLHPEISRYVSFASSNSCASGTPESMEIAAFAAFRA